jgi:Pilus formation protein N terminal region
MIDRLRGTLPIGALLLAFTLLNACTGGSTMAPVPAPIPTPSPSASPTGSPTAGPTAAPSGGSGGQVIVAIPTPAPALCTPASVSVAVGQTVIIDCTSQGYNGPFTVTLGDPAVASAQVANGTFTFFYINGLKVGTTTLSLQFPAGGTGSVPITVTP